MSATADASPRRLSVALIVRDEATMLAEALRSVSSVADEIVVVDTGSTDRTREIAAAQGAKVFEFPWQDDFSAARNRALQEVCGDWVLWLDAGERLSATDAPALRQFVDRKADPSRAYLLMIEVPAETPDGEAEQIACVRLVPNRTELKFQGRVRETLHASLLEANMAVDITPWRIDRTRIEHDAERKQRKASRNLKLAQLELAEDHREPRVLLALGDVYSAEGNYKRARQFFRAAIDDSSRGSTEMLEGYYGLLTAFEANDHEAQLSACIEATEIFPFDAQLFCAMGSYLQAQNRMDLASRSYEAAHRYGQVNPEAWHLSHIGEVASLCLAISLDLLDEPAKAREILKEALERNSHSLKLRRYLIELLIRDGEMKQAVLEVNSLNIPAASRESLRSAVRGACQAARKNWIPAMAYLETAFSSGCRDPLCLRWLTICLVSTGSLLDAEGVLREWERVEPRNAELKKYLDALAQASAAHDDTAEQQASEVPAVDNGPAEKSPPAAVASEVIDVGSLRKLRVDSANHPLDGTIHFQLGSTYRQQGDEQAAEQVWRNYLNRCPDNSQVSSALSELLLDQDRLAEAIEQFDPHNPTAENRPLADLLRGIQAARRGDWQEALQRFESSRAAGYDRPVLFQQMADCLCALGRQQEAETLLRDLVRIQPNSPHAHKQLARFLNRNGRPDEARVLRRKARNLASVPRPHTRLTNAAQAESRPIEYG